jgi:hypothetical protein
MTLSTISQLHLYYGVIVAVIVYMVVGFTTNYAIGAYYHWSGLYINIFLNLSLRTTN